MIKRILFTIPNFDTAGSGKALINIASNLDRNKFEPHIVCMHDRGEYFKVVEKTGIPIHIMEYVSPARPFINLLKGCRKVASKIKAINPDLIHSFHYSADYTEGLAAKFARVPWVFTKKNMSWGGPSARAWKLRSFLAKGIVVQNLDMIKEFYPKNKNIFYIPRGVDIQKFIPKEKKTKIRQKMETLAKERVIICVANMVPVKGIELLINAFINIAESDTPWKLWLVGDIKNDYGKFLSDIVIQKGYSDLIKFSGKVLNVEAYLDHAEIFVLPTKDKGRREGSPVALLEAMANGKVVLGSAVSGVKDQLREFPEHLFKPGVENDLTKKLLELTNNSLQKNLDLGKIFQDFATSKFPIETEIKNHEKFYSTILGTN